jgi:hypothetical protein
MSGKIEDPRILSSDFSVCLSRLFAIFTLVLRHCYIHIEAGKTTYPRAGCRFVLRPRVLKQIRKGWTLEINKCMDVVA